jgi:hypothetical protein
MIILGAAIFVLIIGEIVHEIRLRRLTREFLNLSSTVRFSALKREWVPIPPENKSSGARELAQ